MHDSFALDLQQFGPQARCRRPTLAAARRYCRRLAQRHYENFAVGSLLLPRSLQQHFHAIYAYCRWADDLADETPEGQQALALLQWWRQEFQAMLQGSSRHPVMIALRETIRAFAIPPELFLDLLAAFEQDQTVKEYAAFEQLLAYCRSSANPVGRILLHLFRAVDAESLERSDQICTGLQLANFWQDVALDHGKGRCYLPREDRERFGYADEDLAQRRCTPAFQALMSFEVNRARHLLQAGRALVQKLPSEVSGEVDLIISGGMAILEAIERQQFDVWSRRPTVSKTRQAAMLIQHWLQCRWQQLAPDRCSPCPTDRSASPHRRGWRERISLAQSERYCEYLARQRAGNFYYSFWMLPPEQRMGMCALYAFMRITDDLADDPAPAAWKTAALKRWRDDLDRALRGQFSHRLHPALIRAVQRFRIDPAWFHVVIDGVESDLACRRFQTLAELERYCDQVAGYVGLCCLAVWGCHDPKVLPHALSAGRALQITNILRDVRLDARDNRCYVPLDLMNQHQVREEEIVQEPPPANALALLRDMARIARGHYQDAAAVADFLPHEGWAIWRLMSQTYAEILDRLENVQFQWKGKRFRLPRWRKLQLFIKTIPQRWGAGS